MRRLTPRYPHTDALASRKRRSVSVQSGFTRRGYFMNRVLGITAAPAMLCAALMAIYPAFAQVSKSAATRDDPEYFPVPRTAGTALPFSEAVKVGDLLYVSGQIGNIPGT